VGEAEEEEEEEEVVGEQAGSARWLRLASSSCAGAASLASCCDPAFASGASI